MSSNMREAELERQEVGSNMGIVRKPLPACLVVAVLYNNQRILAQASSVLARRLGRFELVGCALPFVWTDYYESEMGSGLIRDFFVCETLVSRDLLADIKQFTNQLEQQLVCDPPKRQINLDPGLLSLENFVLASTKNQPHRVYLRDGIFAEATLWFVDGSFIPHARTYPDYRTESVRAVLGAIRKRFRKRLSKPDGVMTDFGIGPMNGGGV